VASRRSISHDRLMRLGAATKLHAASRHGQRDEAAEVRQDACEQAQKQRRCTRFQPSATRQADSARRNRCIIEMPQVDGK
jgi:hypothetical protein